MDLASITHYIVTNNCVAHAGTCRKFCRWGGGGSSPRKSHLPQKEKKCSQHGKCFIFQVGRAPLYFCPPPPSGCDCMPLCAYMCHHIIHNFQRENASTSVHMRIQKKISWGGGSGEGQPKKAPPPPTISIKTKVEEDNKDKRHGT